jgi:SHAQKYF class myb-like DNA-binding protein
VLGKVYNQGRWTQVEHLVFLACIIEFGRDWKMIEEFVQTRSSSQARSHAQKVLRKMERAGIVREIKALKNKLKFDAKAHK